MHLELPDEGHGCQRGANGQIADHAVAGDIPGRVGDNQRAAQVGRTP